MKGKKYWRRVLAAAMSAALLCGTLWAPVDMTRVSAAELTEPAETCAHHTHDEACGYDENGEGTCTYECPVCKVQEQIYTLTGADDVTKENVEDVKAQLETVYEAMKELTDEQAGLLDMERYTATAAAVQALSDSSDEELSDGKTDGENSTDEKTDGTEKTDEETGEEADGGDNTGEDQSCAHHTHDEACGHDENGVCAYECPVCSVQKLIDGLPEEITEENVEEVIAQLEAIDEAKAALTDEQMEMLNPERYIAAVGTVSQIKGEAAGAEPMIIDDPVARIGEGDSAVSYDSLEEAVKALEENETLTLLKDVTNTDYSTTINISLPAGAVLNGAGCTLEGNIAVYVNTVGGTVKNVNFKNIHNSSSKLSAVYASGLSGKLTITGCEFDTCDWDAIQTTPVAGAEIDIQGNTFRNTGEQGINTRRYVHVESKANTDFTITVTENKFYDGTKLQETAIEVYYPTDENKVKLNRNYVDEPMSSCIIMNNYSIPNRKPEMVLPFMDEDLENEVMPEADLVKSIYNYYYYPTLQEAVTAAGTASTTITLLKDVESLVEIGSGQDITFRLNGDKKIKEIVNHGTLELISGTVRSNGGSITNNGTLTLNCDSAAGYKVENSGTVNITSGGPYDLNNLTGTGTVSISGGTFTTKPDIAMLEQWYSAKKASDGSGNYVVSMMSIEEASDAGMVASTSSSGGSYYSTITEAANQSGYSVYLQKDSDEAVKFNKGTYRSFYLNGHEFTGSIEMNASVSSINLYGESANLSDVKGTTLNIGSESTSADVTIRNANLNTLDVRAFGVCTVEGGTYGKVTVRAKYGNSDATEPEAMGRLKITGGTFSSNEVTITANFTAKSTIAPLSDYVSAGYKVVDNQNGTYSVVKLSEADEDVSVSVTNLDGTTIYYTSLQEAFDGAEDGAVITLLKDVELDATAYVDSGKNITLNLGDSKEKAHNITSSASGVRGLIISNGSSLNVTGYGNVAAGGQSGEAFIVIGNYDLATWDTPVKSELTIGKNVTVVSENDCCVFHYGNGAVTNVYGSLTSKGDYATIQGQGTINTTINNGGTVVNIYDGASVNCTSREAIYQPQIGETNIYGGTISGATTGVEVRRGVLNISGGTIVSTADTFECGSNTGPANGPTTKGAAVAVAPHGAVGDFGAEVEVTITGGTLKGYYGFYQDDPDGYMNKGVSVDIDITGGTFTAKGSGGKGIESKNCQKFVRPSDNGTAAPVSNTLIDPIYCADGYIPVPVNGGYTVEELGETNAVAALASGGSVKYYDNLEDALKEAAAGDIVTLLQNIGVDAGDLLTIGNDVTLIVKDGVTLTNEGTIEVYGSLEESKVTNRNNGKVNYHIRGIILDDTELDLTLKEEKTLSVTKNPGNALETITVEWSSGNPSVASVDSNGKVTAVGKGKAVLTAKVTVSMNGEKRTFTADCTVNVYGMKQGAPDAPKLKERTYTTITLETIADNKISGAKAQYSKDGGRTWQDSPVFAGLLPGTEYTFTARYHATDDMDYESSQSSETVKISTKKGVEKEELIQEKEELQKALDNTSYTKDEKQIIRDRIAEIDKALAALNEENSGGSSHNGSSSGSSSSGTGSSSATVTVAPTGDNANPIFWMVMIVVVIGAIAGMILLKKHSKRKQ